MCKIVEGFEAAAIAFKTTYSKVPFYNLYTLFKITWGSGWFFLLMLIPFANFVIYIITMVKLGKAFGKGGGFIVGLVLLGTIFELILAFNQNTYLGVPNKTEA